MGARLLALGAALAAAGCFSATPPDGAFSCAPSGRSCPHDYSCVANACYRADGPGPTIDFASSALTATPASVAADGTTMVSLMLQARTAQKRAVPNLPVSVTISGGGATVTPASGSTGSNGSFTASVVSATAEVKVVTFTAGGKLFTVNVRFTAVATAAALQFTQQPSSTAPSAAIVPAVQVQTVDANGAVVPGTRTITLALGANPGAATLGGTLSRTTNANGLASFADLTLDQAGSGYTLVASSGTLPPLTSVGFDVVAGLPSPPTNVMVSAGTTMVTLTWTASPAPIDSYNVQRATALAGPFTTIGTPTAATYVDSGLSAGTYFYKLQAVRGTQVSADSSTVSAIVGRQICVANRGANSVVSHSAGEDGNVAFAQQLTGADTLFSSPTAIAADLVNGEIYVTNRTSPGTLTVYARSTANGDMIPARYISGLANPAGVAVDPTGNEVYVTLLGEVAVAVFPRTWTGTAPARHRTLGSLAASHTTLGSPVGVTLDLANGEMFIVDSVTPYAIDVFATSAMGDIAPSRQLISASLNLPSAVAIDDAHDEMFVANYGTGTVTVFNRTDTGAATPKRSAISGANTGLANPSGLALDSVNGALLVSNYNGGGQGSVLTFLVGDVGNAKPQRSIIGGNTGLTGSYGIAICY